jgi:VWFA-related protein
MARIGVLAALAVLPCVSHARAQTPANADGDSGTYLLKLPVNEVVLTFHAVDAHGLSVNDIKENEIKLFDKGVPPKRVVAFDALLNRPLRAGILIDTSESMVWALLGSKAIAQRFAQRLFRQQTDQAFIMEFGYSSSITQPWTGDSASLARSIQAIRAGRMNPLPGTALIDAVFRACYHGFGKVDPAATANFILLFSDGEDISSHVSIDEALRTCQHSNVAIYAFRAPPASDASSTGPRILAELAGKSGGRVFPADESDEAIWEDLRTIESEQRNQYRLVYQPAQLKQDGAFRPIELQLPDRVKTVEVRSGYFAPQR